MIVNELLKIAVQEKEYKRQKGKGKHGRRKADSEKNGRHGQGRHQKYVRLKDNGKNRNKQLLTSQEHILNSDDGERMRQKQKEQESNIEEDGEHGEVARLISSPPFPPLLSSPRNGSLKSLD